MTSPSSSPAFPVNLQGLAATVDALGAITAAVTAYFTNPLRGIPSPATVYPGEWEQWRNTSDGPPGRVIISQVDPAPIYDVGAYPNPNALRWVGDLINVVDNATGTAYLAPVLGIEAAMFKVIVLGLPNAGATFSTDAPGSAEALAQAVAAKALSHLTWTALRDYFGHVLPPIAWKAMGQERGEHAYGGVLVGGFGPIPVPVLGDVIQVITANVASGTVSFQGTSPGDSVIAPPT